MPQKSRSRSFFLATTSFLSGIAVGMLLNRKADTREWISDWINNRGLVILEKGNRRIKKFRGNIRKEIGNNIPDPYKATENIRLRDRRILGT